MLNVDLVGAAKFNIPHSTFNIQHSNWISPSNEKAAGPVM